MKCMTKYVALDVHQATTVASVRTEGGRMLARTILPTKQSAVVEFFRGMRGAVHVAFEEGTQAQWLHDLLAPLVDRIEVCDRRGEKRQGNKADRVDADELSELLRRGGLRAVYHGSSHRATLKELTRAYQNLVEDSTRVMQRLKALFRARGIKTPGTRVYHPTERVHWLEKLVDRGARLRAEALYADWTCCASCVPRRRLRWSPRRGAIRRGLCCRRFRSLGRCAYRCYWPRCRHPGGFGRSGNSGPSRGWR
jgi:nicotinamidase-related amidase